MAFIQFLSELRILQASTNNPDVISNLEPKPEDYLLWLLIFDLLVFAGLSVYAYISSKRMEKEGTSTEDFRYKFMKSLIVANGGT
jgi:hypothetical protein